jgi:hypothetical protein
MGKKLVQITTALLRSTLNKAGWAKGKNLMALWAKKRF